MNLRKSDLATPICAAGHPRFLLHVKEGVVCSALRRLGADENNMTTPHYDQKDLCILFHWTGSTSSAKSRSI